MQLLVVELVDRLPPQLEFPRDGLGLHRDARLTGLAHEHGPAALEVPALDDETERKGAGHEPLRVGSGAHGLADELEWGLENNK